MHGIGYFNIRIWDVDSGGVDVLLFVVFNRVVAMSSLIAFVNIVLTEGVSKFECVFYIMVGGMVGCILG